MNHPSDMTQGWPTDPQNDELAQFAKQLTDAVPKLPAGSLARVHAQLDTELERAVRRQRRYRIALGWSVAAAVLAALVSYAMLRPTTDEKNPERAPAFVQDRIHVAFSESTQITDTARPLVPLDDYRSLFAD